MAQKESGDYHYTAGTINEQLDTWSIYEDGGSLVLYDGSNEVSFSGLALALGAPLDSHLTADDLDDGEGAVYFYEDSGSVSLHAAYNDGGSIETASAADLVSP